MKSFCSKKLFVVNASRSFFEYCMTFMRNRAELMVYGHGWGFVQNYKLSELLASLGYQYRRRPPSQTQTVSRTIGIELLRWIVISETKLQLKRDLTLSLAVALSNCLRLRCRTFLPQRDKEFAQRDTKTRLAGGISLNQQKRGFHNPPRG
jgi:hypothetical protein